MAKFIIDTADNNISRSMLEMILENYLDYNVHVKEVEFIDEDKLDILAHEHCLNNGYDGLDENDYISIGSVTYGDIMFDIEQAFKEGYKTTKEE